MRQKEQIHQNIIEACKRGSERSKYELYRLYAKAMFNVCYRMMNHREDAEDMLQEAFTQAFMKLHTFRYEANFGTWLKRIVVNTCLNAIQKKKPELTYCEAFYDSDLPPEDDEAYFDNVKLTVEGIARAMEKLPDGSRMIFSLYLFEGYDHAEIAQIMNISESTSKSQFMRAKRRIIEILKEQKHKTT